MYHVKRISIRTTMKNYRPVDLKAIAGNAMRKYGFEPQFPASVVQEVNSIDIRSFPKIPE